MGIRINKMLGWGTSQLDTTRHSLDGLNRDVSTDDFINWVRESVLGDRGASALGRELSETDLMILDLTMLPRDRDSSQWAQNITDTSIWESIVSSPDGTTLVATEFTALSKRLRYGDSIDHYDHIARSLMQGQEPDYAETFTPLDTTIFPHTAYILEDGRIESPQDQHMRQRLKLALNHTSEDLPTLTEQQRELVRTALDNLAEKYGFESLESYEASLHPQIPLEVELALIWTGIFTSSRDIHAVLRPCIYQWWS